jgi:hypothetical protein
VGGDAWADADLPAVEVRAAADVTARLVRIDLPAAADEPRSATGHCASPQAADASRVEAQFREARLRVGRRHEMRRYVGAQAEAHFREAQHCEMRHLEEQRPARPQAEVPQAADSCCWVVRLGSSVTPAWCWFDGRLCGWPGSW